MFHLLKQKGFVMIKNLLMLTALTMASTLMAMEETNNPKKRTYSPAFQQTLNYTPWPPYGWKLDINENLIPDHQNCWQKIDLSLNNTKEQRHDNKYNKKTIIHFDLDKNIIKKNTLTDLSNMQELSPLFDSPMSDYDNNQLLIDAALLPSTQSTQLSFEQNSSLHNLKAFFNLEAFFDRATFYVPVDNDGYTDNESDIENS